MGLNASNTNQCELIDARLYTSESACQAAHVQALESSNSTVVASAQSTNSLSLNDPISFYLVYLVSGNARPTKHFARVFAEARRRR